MPSSDTAAVAVAEPVTSSSFVDRLSPRIVAIVAGAIAFLLYVLTLAPTFGFVDKGEMAAVASTLGIAHPTGYPTIMLLGKLFTLLLPMRDVVALNVMAAVLTGIGAAILVLLYDRLLRMVDSDVREESIERKGGKKAKGKKEAAPQERRALALPEVPTRGSRALLAGIGALLTALTATWWSQGNSFEVYSLHCLMLPLVTLLFLRYVDDETQKEGRRALWEGREQHEGEPRSDAIGFSARGFWFAFALGLSFTNHLTTVLLAPAFLYWYFAHLGFSRRSVMRLIYLIPPFLLGLLPYAWLPLRAASDPAFNWGNPDSLWGFWRHVTGAQYRVWMNTNAETFPQQTAFFLSNLSSETVWIGLALAVFGVVLLTRRRPLLSGATIAVIAIAFLYLLYVASELGPETPPARGEESFLWGTFIPYLLLLVAFGWFYASNQKRSTGIATRVNLFVALLFLVCIFYGAMYDIMEIGPYYLLAFMAVGIWMLFGLRWMWNRIGSRMTLALGAAFVLVTGAFNYGAADESGNVLVEDLTVNMLETLPDSALIFSAQWDFWVAGSFYMQGAEGMRRDVLVIDPELLRRSWYLDQLETTHPEFMRLVSSEVSRFRPLVDKFERGVEFDHREIETAYRDLLRGMFELGMGRRPVFVTMDIFPEESGVEAARIPYHLAYRISREPAYLPQEWPRYRFNTWDERNGYTAMIHAWYAQSALDRAAYEKAYGKDSLAAAYLDLAKSYDPNWHGESIPSMPLNSEQRYGDIMTFFANLRGKTVESIR